MRRNTSQLSLFEWTPVAQPDKRAACIAMFATASAAAVGARYGVSRDAVLGYVHRARLAGLPVATRPAKVRGGKRRPIDLVPTRPALPLPSVRAATVGTPMPKIRVDVAPLITVAPDDMPALFGLGDRQCRAITDDETGECCGLPTEGRSSWCRAHRAAYRAGRV